MKNGTCIQSLRALSDNPLSYDVTRSLKHSDKFCDPVAFLNREEPSWRNPVVQQSFCWNSGHGLLVTIPYGVCLVFWLPGLEQGTNQFKISLEESLQLVFPPYYSTIVPLGNENGMPQYGDRILFPVHMCLNLQPSPQWQFGQGDIIVLCLLWASC